MAEPRVIQVFIASPGDLAEERREFKNVIDELNRGFGRGANVRFDPLGWEDALAQVGRRSQSVINQDIDRCDVFVLVMWRRWGQEAPDAGPYSSYTEEEFYRALARFEKDGAPTIFVFFKRIDPGQMADPGEQLKKVLAFRAELERTRKVLYHPFDDLASFRREIDTHLVAFAQGKCEPSEPGRELPLVPESIRAELQRQLAELETLRADRSRALADAEQARKEARTARAEAEAAAQVAEERTATRALALAEDAAKAALDGRIEEARQKFALALEGTSDLRTLYLGYEFFKRIGELNEAERLLRSWLAISGPENQTSATAAALGNLGVILTTRGSLDEAEEMLRKSLAIFESLVHLEGMSSQYGNLGLVLQTRGDFDGAEVMHRKSLEIEEKLGKFDGMAAEYVNLGLLLKRRGSLDQAEDMLRKALNINKKIGNLEGMASSLGNLGLILYSRGDLEGAETMHREALAIDEKLKRLEGMANAYGNLGRILATRRDFDEAEKMHRMSLAIEEKLGRLEGMASEYASLGGIMKIRGRLDQARELWMKALFLFNKLGAKHHVARVQGWIDELPT